MTGLNLSRCMEMEITFPVYNNKDKDHDYRTIDGLSFLTNDIIGECHCDGINQVLVLLLADCDHLVHVFVLKHS